MSIKISLQVVAMGGRGSRDYLEFHKFCCKATPLPSPQTTFGVEVDSLISQNVFC